MDTEHFIKEYLELSKATTELFEQMKNEFGEAWPMAASDSKYGRDILIQIHILGIQKDELSLAWQRDEIQRLQNL